MDAYRNGGRGISRDNLGIFRDCIYLKFVLGFHGCQTMETWFIKPFKIILVKIYALLCMYVPRYLYLCTTV